MSKAPSFIVCSPRKDVVEEKQTKGEGKKKKRKLTSKVWDDLKRVKIKGEEKAKCNHCGTLLSLSTSSATTHLSRHLKTCDARAVAKSGNQGWKLADLILWKPSFLGAKSEMVNGDPNANMGEYGNQMQASQLPNWVLCRPRLFIVALVWKNSSI